MPIEDSISHKEVAEFLRRNNWKLLEYVGLRVTANVFIVERNGERSVLKISKDRTKVDFLKTEHELLKYLDNTDMKLHVPEFGGWIDEIEGFLMESLRYPTPEESRGDTWMPRLAILLRTLHSINLPSIKGITDDLPDIRNAIIKRFCDLFRIVLNGDEFWVGLPKGDRPKLELVRRHYETYRSLVFEVESTMKYVHPALTHGDLAGDNIMLKQDGVLTFVDWGETRISSPLTDLACLLSYRIGSEDRTQDFLNIYFDSPEALEKNLPCLQVLIRLYRYRSCVQSLLWLNEEGETGLDVIGRAHFEKVLAAL